MKILFLAKIINLFINKYVVNTNKFKKLHAMQYILTVY